MALFSYYAMSTRDFSPVYDTGGTNTDSTKWYLVTGTIATSAHQTAVAYTSAVGIGSLGVQTAVAGTILPAIDTATYDVYVYAKSWGTPCGYVRVNGGGWSVGSGAQESVYKWIKLGSLALKTGDLLEFTNHSGGGSGVMMDMALVPPGRVPTHVPTGREGFRTITSSYMTTASSVSQMTIGDRIPFRYVATDNYLGTIDQLGTAQTSTLLVTRPAPNGTAYFIMIGYDSKGRKKLVSDRVLQNSISWDTLNNAGVASGSGLPITIDDNDGYTLRLLSGGTSAADKDNEWDKIVSESSLNGAITAGSTTVWNWSNIYSWVSTTASGVPANRTIRGYGSVAAMSSSPSSSVSANCGFRPILIVDARASFTVNGVTPTHLYVGQHSGCILDASAAFYGVPMDYKIKVNNVDFDTYGPASQRTIPIDTFVVGVNNIVLEATDGGLSRISVILEEPHRLVASRTLLSYDGGYSLSNVILTGTANPTASSGTLQTTPITAVDLHGYSGVSGVNVSGTGGKYAASFDSGATWKSYEGGTWVGILANNISTQGMSMTTLNSISPAQWSDVFQRTQLDLLAELNTGDSLTGLSVSLPPNSGPIINSTVLSPGTLHSGVANLTAVITEPEEDTISYRLTVGDEEIVPWTNLKLGPIYVNHDIPWYKTKIGSNIVKLEAKDNVGAISTPYTGELIRTDVAPNIIASRSNRILSFSLSDVEGDYVNYRITVNGNVRVDWSSEYKQSPHSVTYKVDRHDVNIGVDNTVTIECMDSYGAVATQDIVFMGEYSGLLFSDISGNLYSDDQGNVLIPLILGPIVSGQTSEVYEVTLTNKTGLALLGTSIKAKAGTVPAGVTFKLSTNDGDNFEGIDEVNVPGIMQPSDSITFYVRAVAGLDTVASSTIQLEATARLA